MTSGSGSDFPFFEKLQDESNYTAWKFQMELYLIHNGLWKYITISPESKEFVLDQDQLARAKICLMVEKDCYVYLQNTKSAREAWEALRNVFEDAEVTNSSRLFNKLVSLKLEQFGTIRQYVAEVTLAAQKLKDIGKGVDDELLATILLQGLTEEYKIIRFEIENSDNALTSDYVKKKLLSIDNRHSSQGLDELRVRRLKKRQRKSTRDQLLKCRICRGIHTERECPESSLAVSSEIERTYYTKRYAGARYGANATNAELLMDSGDYAHMTNRKDYPCFLLLARMTVWCLVKMFKLW